MEEEKEATWDDVVGAFVLLISTIGLIFYKAMLVMIVWGWFIEPFSIALSYSGALLLMLIWSLFGSGSGAYRVLRMEKKLFGVKREEFDFQFREFFSRFAQMTILFGVLGLIYVTVN